MARASLSSSELGADLSAWLAKITAQWLRAELFASLVESDEERGSGGREGSSGERA